MQENCELHTRWLLCFVPGLVYHGFNAAAAA